MRTAKVLAALVLGLVAVSGCGTSQPGYVGASSIEREITDAKAATPLPPGGSFWDINLDPKSIYQPGEGRDMIEYQAMCEWHRYWIAGLTEGDEAKVEKATAWADSLRSWAIYTSSREAQAYIDRIQGAARLGDPSLLQDEVKVNCERPSSS